MDQSFTPTYGNRGILIFVVAFAVAALILYAVSVGSIGILTLLLFGAYGIVYYFQDLLRNRMRRKETSKGINITLNFLMAFVIFEIVINGGILLFGNGKVQETDGFRWENSQKFLPLSLSDLLGDEFTDSAYSEQRRTQGTVFLSQMSASQTPDGFQQNEQSAEYWLDYVLTKVHVKNLYGVTRDSMMKFYAGEQPWTEAKSWGTPDDTVEMVYETSVQRNGQSVNRYLLCMTDRILKLDLSFVPDTRQQEIIAGTIEDL